MYQTLIVSTQRIQLWKKAPTEGGSGYRSEADGFQDGDVMIEVDVEKLFKKLAGRAMRNRNGTASLAEMAVRARVIERRKVP